MKNSLKFVGCGLLVLALSSLSVGCKSKSSGGSDAGTDSGTPAGGSGGKGSAGTGAGGKGGSGGGGGSGATLTMQQCTDMTVAKGSPAACASCVCSKNLSAASACATDMNCWSLIGCVATMCGGASDIACITSKCASSLGGATPAMGLTSTLTMMCASECIAPRAGNDAGTDAGH